MQNRSSCSRKDKIYFGNGLEPSSREDIGLNNDGEDINALLRHQGIMRYDNDIIISLQHSFTSPFNSINESRR